MMPVVMILISIFLNGDIKLDHKVMTAFECMERQQINRLTTPEELQQLGLQNRGISCVVLPENYNNGTPARN